VAVAELASEAVVAEAEAEIADAVEEVVADEIAAAAVLEDAVEEAVAAGEITPEDGALIETAIEEAAAEAISEDIAAGAELVELLEEEPVGNGGEEGERAEV
jgi:hypothetical protein